MGETPHAQVPGPPLSFAQEQMWFIHEYNRDHARRQPAAPGKRHGPSRHLSAQATELQGELSRIGNDARTLARHPSSSDTHDLNAAVKELRSHAAPLIGQMQAVCPNS